MLIADQYLEDNCGSFTVKSVSLSDLHLRVMASNIRVTTSAALTANIATTDNTATQHRFTHLHVYTYAIYTFFSPY